MVATLTACKGNKKGEPAQPPVSDAAGPVAVVIDAAAAPAPVVDAPPAPPARTEPAVFFVIWDKNVAVPLACVEGGQLHDTETCLDLVPDGAQVGLAGGKTAALGKRKDLDCSADAGSTVGRVVTGKDLGDWAVWPPEAASLVATLGEPGPVADDVKATLASAAGEEPGKLTIERAVEVDLDGDGAAEQLYVATVTDGQSALYAITGGKAKRVGYELTVLGLLDLRGAGHHEVWLHDTASHGHGVYQWTGKALEQIGSWGCSNEMP